MLYSPFRFHSSSLQCVHRAATVEVEREMSILRARVMKLILIADWIAKKCTKSIPDPPYLVLVHRCNYMIAEFFPSTVCGGIFRLIIAYETHNTNRFCPTKITRDNRFILLPFLFFGGVSLTGSAMHLLLSIAAIGETLHFIPYCPVLQHSKS